MRHENTTEKRRDGTTEKRRDGTTEKREMDNMQDPSAEREAHKSQTSESCKTLVTSTLDSEDPTMSAPIQNLFGSNKRQKMSTVAVDLENYLLAGSPAPVLTTFYERPNGGGPERSYVSGPMKWTTTDEMDRYAAMVTEQLVGLDLSELQEAIEKVAYPFSLSRDAWRGLVVRHGATSLSVRNPKGAEVRGTGMDKVASVWAVDFKVGSVRRHTVYFFWGTFFESVQQIGEFCKVWGETCPAASLKELEEVMMNVRVPKVARPKDIKPLAQVNAMLQRFAIGDVRSPSTFAQLKKTATALVSPR